MPRKVCITTILLLLVLSPRLNAQELFLAGFEGAALEINPLEQYVTLHLVTVARPKMRENSFWEKVFLKRKDFGLCKLTASYGGKPFQNRTITPFSYEKTDRRNYDYVSIGVSQGVSYPILPPIVFPFRGSISLDLSLSNWEKSDNNAAVRKIVQKLPDLPSTAGEVLDMFLIALDILEDLFPPENRREVLKMSIELPEIRERLVINCKTGGRQKPLLKIRFDKQGAMFEKFDFETPTQSQPFFHDLEAWRKAIEEAAKEAKRKKDPGPIKSVMLAFSVYTSKLPLVKKDKSLFIAGALHNWIPNVVKSCNAPYCFKASNFQQIPAADLKYVRETEWDFSGVSCDTQACIDFSDFVQKSRTIQGREEAVKYLRERLDVFLHENRVGKLSPEEYRQNLVIIKASYFNAKAIGTEIEYTFEPGDIYLVLNENEYRSNKIKFYQSYEGGKNIITRIEIES